MSPRVLLAIGLMFTAMFTAACSAPASPSSSPGIPLLGAEEVDTSMAAVPLEEVVFDTFDGGSMSLAVADPRLIEQLDDRIPPIDEPVYETPEEARGWLDDQALVIGYVDGEGRAYAYPHAILNYHEIVNDTLAGVPVLVSYCPLCRSGVVYDRRLDRRELTFGNTSALHDNDMVMVDRQTATYWWQTAGRGIVGTLTDAELRTLPSTTSTLGGWLARHPTLRVLSRDTGVDRPYERDPFTGYGERVDGGSVPFPRPTDAVPLEGGPLPAGTTVLVIDTDAGPTAVALDGQERSVDLGAVVVLVGADPGEGEAVDATGVVVASRRMLWFAAVAAFPEVRPR